MKKGTIIAFAGMALVASLSAAAGEKEDQGRIREELAKVIPGKAPDNIRKAPLAGLYEVSYGAELYYVSADGRYVLRGDLVDLKNHVNLTEERRSAARLEALEKVKKGMIVFAPKGETKHTVTVFTDIDCAYCRKLHGGMKEMNDLGIAVRYLAFPRAGIGSGSYDKSVSVWCAKDQRQAMDAAKNKGEVTPAKCENPVAEHLALGQELGVSGTPALVLEDGRMLPGYLPPDKLLHVLEGKL